MERANEKINQHFVPQFYLRNFSNNINGKCISGYELKSKKFVENITIKETASKKYYYGEDGVVEDWFANLEGVWNRIVSKIIETDEIPDDIDDYLHLLLLISLSEMRAFKFGNAVNKMFEGMHRHIARFNGNTKVLGKQYDMSQHPISFMLNHLVETADIYEMLSPLLIINEAKYDFITSDNPCVKYNQLFVGRNLDYGLRHRGLQIFLPLSPRICLCFYDSSAYKIPNKDSKEIVKIYDAIQIREFNKLFLRNATQMIYFQDGRNHDNVTEIVRDHKFYQHDPFIKTYIPVFGVKMECINDYYEFDFFQGHSPFVKKED